MMSDETYVALIRRAVAAFDPATVTDANEIREHQGRVAYLARIDGGAPVTPAAGDFRALFNPTA